jgi:hypothetical protein
MKMEKAICQFKYMILSTIIVVVLYVVASTISYTNFSFMKTEINQDILTTNLLLKWVSNENTTISLIANHHKPDYADYVIGFVKDMTNIQIDDVNSYLLNELIGVDFDRKNDLVSPFAFESSPPLEVLIYERELSTRELGEHMLVNNEYIETANEEEQSIESSSIDTNQEE